jgi:hypothetical protein
VLQEQLQAAAIAAVVVVVVLESLQLEEPHASRSFLKLLHHHHHHFHLPISQPGLLLLHASVVITSCSNLEERCRRQACVTALAAGRKWYLIICECVVVAGCMYFASADRSADEKWRSSFRK